jgi:hypothetical protein
MLRSRLENLEYAILNLKADCAQEYRRHVMEGDNLDREYFHNLDRLQTLIAEHAVVQYMVETKWME